MSYRLIFALQFAKNVQSFPNSVHLHRQCFNLTLIPTTVTVLCADIQSLTLCTATLTELHSDSQSLTLHPSTLTVLLADSIPVH